jgi:hypothetical protein
MPRNCWKILKLSYLYGGKPETSREITYAEIKVIYNILYIMLMV